MTCQEILNVSITVNFLTHSIVRGMYLKQIHLLHNGMFSDFVSAKSTNVTFAHMAVTRSVKPSRVVSVE